MLLRGCDRSNVQMYKLDDAFSFLSLFGLELLYLREVKGRSERGVFERDAALLVPVAG